MNFLDALKAKSAQMNQDRGQSKANSAPVQSAPAVSQPRPATVIKQSFYDQVVAADPRLEIVTNRNRLDLFFSIKPSQEIRDALLRHGWHYDGERLCWRHQDNEANRDFLRKSLFLVVPTREDSFGTTATTTDVMQSSQTQTPIAPAINVPESTPTTTEEVGQSDDIFAGEHYARYRNQVDELIGALKLRPADLMILAIDTLWRKTFQ